jgi:hypothetical protein
MKKLRDGNYRDVFEDVANPLASKDKVRHRVSAA